MSRTVEDTYKDAPLYADREYVYTFDTFNSSGNRTESAGNLSTRTSKPEIVWSGLGDASAFDSSLETYTFGRSGDSISWNGDLSNKQINLTYKFTRSLTESVDLAFYDTSGNQLSATNSTTNIKALSHRLSGRSSTMLIASFIVPVGAVQIKVINHSSYGYPINFHDISEN